MPDNNIIEKDLGPVSAWAIAKANGFDGTEAEWEALQANAAQNGSDAEAFAKGTRNGEAVASDDPAYHNNCAYHHAGTSADADTCTTKAAEATAAAATASAAYNVNLLAPNYSAESTYAVGNHVIYNGGYYECISAISTAEAWTAAHWRQLTVGGESADLKSALENEIASTNEANGYMDNPFPMFIDSSGKWVSDTGASHIMIPVFSGDSVVITADAQVVLYGFLKSLKAPVANQSADFCSGTSRSVLYANTTVTVTAPSDAKYLYIGYMYSDVNHLPKSITINSLDVLTGIRKEISDIKTRTVTAEKNISINTDAIKEFCAGSMDLTAGTDKGYYDGSSITGTGSLVYTYLHAVKPYQYLKVEWTTLTSVNPVLYTKKDGVQTSYGGSTGSYSVDLSDCDEFYINFFGSTYVEKFTVTTLMCVTKEFIDRTNDLLDAFNDAESIGYEIGTDIEGTKYTGKYIGTDYKIKSPSDTTFYVYKYSVTKGNHYKLYGSGKTYNGDLPLAMFGAYDIDGMASSMGVSIIPGGSTGAIRYYEVDYYAEHDGYVYIAGYGTEANYGIVKFANTVDRVSGMTNLKIQAFGDSITDNTWGSAKTSWAQMIHNYLPTQITMVNSGVAGSTIAHCYSTDGRYSEKTDGNGIVDLVTDGTLELNNDVIVIFGGTNDWSGTTHLGEWTDENNNYTIPALKTILEHITTNTKAKVLVCTPLPRYNAEDQQRHTNSRGVPWNGDDKTLRDYCDAIIEVCNFYHIPVLDLNYEIGWNRYNLANFSADKLHPTPQGSKIVSMMIAAKIKSMYGI